MSARLTLAQVKQAQVGMPVGIPSNHPQFVPLLNEILELYWNAGDWIGKNQRIKFRVVADCQGNRMITWPNQIETIEALRVCDRPFGIRNAYYEFLMNGAGEIGAVQAPWSGGELGWGAFGRGGGLSLVGDRGEVVSNEEINPGKKLLRIYAERVETRGQVRLLGYDDNGLPIRTLDVNGNWQDGEVLVLANAPATTVNYFSNLTGVQFTGGMRAGNIWLYEVDENGVERQIGSYDYAIETPVFRRSFISGLPRWFESQKAQCVTALAKLRFQPVRCDTDYPQVSNIAALKLGFQHIYKRDNDKVQEAEIYWQKGLSCLRDELKQFNGYGAPKPVNFSPGVAWSTTPNIG